MRELVRGKNVVAVFPLLMLLTFSGCHRTSSGPMSEQSNVTGLEECDLAGYIPCVEPAAFLSILVPDSGLYLTYSSEWVPGSPMGSAADARTLGLGGWSINFVQRYDAGHRILFSGDGSWRVADSVALPSGERAVPSFDGSVAYIFDSAGHHVRTVDGHLGTVLIRFSYDAAGRLTQVDGVQDGEPVHASVERNPDGTARALVGTDGGTTALAVDEKGQLAKVIDPAGGMTQIEWDGGRVVSRTDPLGGVARYSYDPAGWLTSVKDEDGAVKRYERKVSRDSIEIQVVTALGRHWSYRSQFSSEGLRRTFVARDGSTSTETTDSHGTRKIRLADGTNWEIGAVANPVWGPAAPILTPMVATRPDGVASRREVKYALQPQARLPYRLAGTVTTTINGRPWVETFDPARRSKTLEDPAHRRTTSNYDAEGRLLSQSVPGEAPVSYTYNAEGRVSSETHGSGQLARTTRFSYDAASGETTVTWPDGTMEKTAVDRGGRAVSVSAGDGSTVVRGYNSGGRLTQIQPPGGLSFTLGTSPAGRPTAFVPPMVEADSSAETMSYDGDGRLMEISGLGKRSIALDYDDSGRVASWTFDQGKLTVSYDDRSGLLKQASDPSGVVTSYGYSGNLPNRLAWSGLVNGAVSVTLDADGRPTAESVNGAGSVDFAYDASGELTKAGPLTLTRDAGSGLVTHTAMGVVETTRQFDSNGQLVRSTTKAAGKPILDLRYTRDAVGRIKTAAATGSDGKASTTEYSYDRAGQLAAVRVSGRTLESESYDLAGNRITVARPGGKLNASYDDRNQMINWGPTRYTWAPDGHLMKRGDGRETTAFTFDDFGALRAAMLPGGREIKYLVDDAGRRVGRAVAGKLVAGYLYRLDGSLAAETDASGKIVARFAYDEEGRLALVQRGGVNYRVITDAVGSPLLLLDSRTGAVADAITYDAWGSVTRETAPGVIPVGFAGGLRDLDTGLVHFGARDYDPGSGRWTAADPLRFDAGDANLYRYVAGDPVNGSDPTGLAGGKKPSQNKPPQNNNPPPNGNPPNNPDPAPDPTPWHCSSPNGPCQGPGKGPQNDWGCAHGSCGRGPNGFWCKAMHCWGPNGGDLCLGLGGVPCSWGEPHLTNQAGVRFDFQAAGEFLVASSPDGKFVIQAREEPLFGRTDVTFNTAVAANVEGDRIGVYAKEPVFLMVNGAALNDPELRERRLPHGGILERQGGLVSLTWRDGSRLTAIRIGNTVNYGFVPSAARSSLQGLLGGDAGNRGKELVGRDGVELKRSDPGYDSKLYQQFGKSWRIRQAESLFHYWPGESTTKFTNLKIPSRSVSAASLSSASRSKAEAICRAVGIRTQPVLDDCILDVGITGMPAFAAGPAAGATGAALVAAAFAPTLPSQQTRTAVNELKLGQSESGVIRSAKQRDSYGFDVSAGQIVYLQAHGPCVKDLEWSLLRPDGSLQGYDQHCNDLGRQVLAKGGRYVVEIGSHPSSNASGAYSFSILPVVATTPRPLTLGTTVNGSIAYVGEWQDYTFTAHTGQTVYLQAHGNCIPDLEWHLLRPDGSIQSYDQNCRDIGRQVLAKGGSYIIRIGSNRTATGNYSFTTIPVPTPAPRPVSVGATVNGAIAHVGEWQDYTFTARAGQIVFLQAHGTCVPDLEWHLLRPDGSLQDYNQTCRDIGRQVLAKAGSYVIRIRSNRTATGNYSFTLRNQK